MEMFLPAIKADFSAYETLDRTCVTTVRCPITALAGRDDAVVAPAVMQEWHRHTEASFDLRIVPGDHFFVSSSGELVLSTIREKLLSTLLERPIFLQQPGFAGESVMKGTVK